MCGMYYVPTGVALANLAIMEEMCDGGTWRL